MIEVYAPVGGYVTVGPQAVRRGRVIDQKTTYAGRSFVLVRFPGGRDEWWAVKDVTWVVDA